MLVIACWSLRHIGYYDRLGAAARHAGWPRTVGFYRVLAITKDWLSQHFSYYDILVITTGAVQLNSRQDGRTYLVITTYLIVRQVGGYGVLAVTAYYFYPTIVITTDWLSRNIGYDTFVITTGVVQLCGRQDGLPRTLDGALGTEQFGRAITHARYTAIFRSHDILAIGAYKLHIRYCILVMACWLA